MTEQPAKPCRVQLSRRKGWRMPPNTVSVARPTRWGNPYRVGVDGTAAECVRKFSEELLPYTHHGKPSERLGNNRLADALYSIANVEHIQAELRGKNLACWCAPDQPCHADVLLRIANTP